MLQVFDTVREAEGCHGAPNCCTTKTRGRIKQITPNRTIWWCCDPCHGEWGEFSTDCFDPLPCLRKWQSKGNDGNYQTIRHNNQGNITYHVWLEILENRFDQYREKLLKNRQILYKYFFIEKWALNQKIMKWETLKNLYSYIYFSWSVDLRSHMEFKVYSINCANHLLKLNSWL